MANTDPNRKCTHQVLDLTMTPDEGQESYSGSEQDCHAFIEEQCEGGIGTSTWEVVPIIKSIQPTEASNWWYLVLTSKQRKSLFDVYKIIHKYPAFIRTVNNIRPDMIQEIWKAEMDNIFSKPSKEQQYKVLMWNGQYINPNMLSKGLYCIADCPQLYSIDTTTDTLYNRYVEMCRRFQDEKSGTLLSTVKSNLNQCEMVTVTLTIN